MHRFYLSANSDIKRVCVCQTRRLMWMQSVEKTVLLRDGIHQLCSKQDLQFQMSANLNHL
ncbi:hypothetical protein BDE02_04G162200 [Populus trichocarpa]|nr:hypothetical protein BDE02_04G162200 [Populus trichocarpa]